jgi:hypothetical protein
MSRTLRWPCFIVLALSLISSGCGLARLAEAREQIAAARKTFDDELASCARSHPERYKKPVTPSVRCIGDATMKFNTALDRIGGNRDLDLARLMTSRLVVAAVHYDAGRSSQAQFDAELAAAMSDYKTQQLQRRNSAAMVAAAKSQAAAAHAQADAARQAANAVALPTMVTCSRVGNSVTCF